FAQNPNPASRMSVEEFRKIRKPYSSAGRKFEVPPGTCPGYHLHMFAEHNIGKAIEHGYQLVTRGEVYGTTGWASRIGSGDSETNTDMGDNVSIVGSPGSNERLVLMKLPLEFWEDDVKARMERELAIAKHIFGDALEAPDSQTAANYGSANKIYSPTPPVLSRGNMDKGGRNIIGGIFNRGLSKPRRVQTGG
ncbi:MAG: hypothetical protein ACREF7_00790, partial [Candidatus Saccharimonadales bacterium]